MSFESLLIHECDVYHLRERTVGGGYGVPGTTEYYYDTVPDKTDVTCYWQKQTLRIANAQPADSFIEVFLVMFLPTEDIRPNDKVIFKGTKYRLHIPDNIRDHHIEVTAERDDAL